MSNEIESIPLFQYNEVLRNRALLFNRIEKLEEKNRTLEEENKALKFDNKKLYDLKNALRVMIDI